MRDALIVLATFVTLAFSTQAQTAEELVNKNIQAKGGMEKIKAIKSVRIKGKLIGGGGFTAATLQENERPNKVRETFSLQGMTAVTAYDSATGWQIQPFGGHKDPELMGEDDLRDLLLDADFDGPLVDYKEKGNTVEFMGHDEVDGDDALRLKVTLKDGDIILLLSRSRHLFGDTERSAGIYSRLNSRDGGRSGIVQAGCGRDVSLLDFAGKQS